MLLLEFLKRLVRARTVGYLFLDRNRPVNESSRCSGNRRLPLPVTWIVRELERPVRECRGKSQGISLEVGEMLDT